MIEKFEDNKSLFFILLAVFIVHAPLILNDFHTDDFHVLAIMDKGFDFQAFKSMENPANFRPLSNLVIFIRYIFFDKLPALWYLLNIALHLFAVSLLFLFLKDTVNRTTALWGSLFFGIYFQHFEAVLWLYGIVRLTATIFLLLTLIYHRRSIDNFNKGDIYKNYIFFTLGLFCAEEFIVVALFFAVDAFIAGRQSKYSLRIYGAGFVIISVIYLAVRMIALNTTDFATDYFFIGGHILKNIYLYAGWMILPQLDHPHLLLFVQKSFPGLTPLIPIFNMIIFALALLFSLLIIRYGRKTERLALFLIVITLIPATLLNFKVSTKLVYIPSIGFGILAGSFFSRLLERSRLNKLNYLIWVVIVYLVIQAVAINLTIKNYRDTQEKVAFFINELKRLDINWDEYEYFLLDNLPGRTRMGPALKYRFGYAKNFLEVNEQPDRLLNLEEEKRKLVSARKGFIIIDFKSGVPIVNEEYGNEF